MAPRKKIDPIKAKEAKQKKIAIGGMALLCLLLAFQGPKTLKMLKGPQPVSPAAAAAATPVATPPAGATIPAAGATVPGEAVAAGSADLASVADSDQAPVPAEGQFVSFERFESKDPFAPQATAVPASGGKPADGSGGDGTTTVPEPGTTASPKPDGSTTVDGGFTPAPAGGSSSPSTPTLAAATSISVNDVPEDVTVDKPFPDAQPTFVLVSVAKNGKSVELGIAGGSYANGEQTIRLAVGKTLTLQNTADGTRYELELLTVAGFAVPTPKP